MKSFVYIVPLVCAAIGFYLSSNLAIRGRIRAIGLLVLGAALAFGISIQLGESATGWDGVGYGVFALLIIIPFAIGLVFGAIFGLLRRRKLRASDG